jgi:hypothetical protein
VKAALCRSLTRLFDFFRLERSADDATKIFYIDGTFSAPRKKFELLGKHRGISRVFYPPKVGDIFRDSRLDRTNEPNESAPCRIRRTAAVVLSLTEPDRDSTPKTNNAPVSPDIRARAPLVSLFQPIA